MTCEAFPDPKSQCFSDESRRDGAPSDDASPPHASGAENGSLVDCDSLIDRDSLVSRDSLAERPTLSDSLEAGAGTTCCEVANSARSVGESLEEPPVEERTVEERTVEERSVEERIIDVPSAEDRSVEERSAEQPFSDEAFIADERLVIDDPIALGEPLSAEERRKERMARCEQRIGYEFRDKQLLQGALTHASGAQHRLASNERLEFLGDAVLGLFVCELLFHRYPQFQEGDLTRVKSVVVSRQTCAKLSALLGLDEFLIMGKGMASNRSIPQSLMADVFESLVAALYLDGGSDVVREFLGRYITPEISLVTSGAQGDNYKSLLQQFSQRKLGATPTYQLLDEKGPDHSKCFLIRARVGGREFPPAWGRNKKEAEQRAACNAMAFLNDEPLPFPDE